MDPTPAGPAACSTSQSLPNQKTGWRELPTHSSTHGPFPAVRRVPYGADDFESHKALGETRVPFPQAVRTRKRKGAKDNAQGKVDKASPETERVHDAGGPAHVPRTKHARIKESAAEVVARAPLKGRKRKAIEIEDGDEDDQDYEYDDDDDDDGGDGGSRARRTGKTKAHKTGKAGKPSKSSKRSHPDHAGHGARDIRAFFHS
ncbi:hypothetical protein PV04_09765 [Phialophora macrospora]|uniref:Uncharacterized protein n=1 Tax=Phialophora macrospora TaxID=1851006 RepID=A0A0D2F4R0_9EURO|nr:hypothetical protein PV04_09765 [Phialophora macrospora]